MLEDTYLCLENDDGVYIYLQFHSCFCLLSGAVIEKIQIFAADVSFNVTVL